MTRPGLTTIKTLFALSCNRCAFPGCDQRLADPLWNGVRADIAHIRGERPGAARYAPEMSDQDRNALDNLILLCPNHHREIDRLRPQDWPAERLFELKAQHERDCRREDWASDSLLEFYSSLLASAEAEAAGEGPANPPRLIVRMGAKSAFEVVNIGDSDAFHVRVEDASPEGTTGLLRLESGEVTRLSPGASWRAGHHMRTFGSTGLAVVRVVWQDSSDHSHDAEFPMS